MIPNLLLSIISGEASAAAQRARRSVVAYLVVSVASLVAFGFLLLALYLYAARHHDPLIVAIAFGGGFLGLAVAVLIYHRISARMRARRARQRMTNEALALGIPLALTLLPALLTRRGAALGLTVPVVSAIAYLIYRENAGSHDRHEGDNNA